MMPVWKELLTSYLTTLPKVALAEITGIGHRLTHASPVPRVIPPPSRKGEARSFDGTKIYWELHGPLPHPSLPRPMVFCYGLVCHMNQWRAQLERYAPERPCLLLDYRGHHRSEFPADPSRMNLSALAKDVAAVIRDAELNSPAHVWGHSLGVNVALELAAAEPDLVRSLVLVCGDAQNPFKNMLGLGVLDKLMNPILASYHGLEGPYAVAWKVMQARPEFTELVVRMLGFNTSAGSSGQDVAAYSRSVASIDPRTFFLLLLELSKGMTNAILPKVRVPALVVAGGRDQVTPPAQMRIMAETLPNAAYVEVPAGSHNAQLDFGEFIGLKVEEFWRRERLE